LADHLPDASTIRRRAADIFEGLIDGSLSIEIADRYNFNEVERAHKTLEERRTIGKPIMEIA
jgi:NADPH2:quinone reductase